MFFSTIIMPIVSVFCLLSCHILTVWFADVGHSYSHILVFNFWQCRNFDEDCLWWLKLWIGHWFLLSPHSIFDIREPKPSLAISPISSCHRAVALALSHHLDLYVLSNLCHKDKQITGESNSSSELQKKQFCHLHHQQVMSVDLSGWVNSKNTFLHYKYEYSSHLRGNLMHNLGRGVLQRVLQVVLKVAEELPGSSLHHIQQSSTITGIHIWECYQPVRIQRETKYTHWECKQMLNTVVNLPSYFFNTKIIAIFYADDVF